MIFDSWYGLVRVVVAGTLAYVALIIVLRTTGKRTLSKMNAFDFVITVALGSTLATIVLSRDVAILEGVVALIVLVMLQYAVAWVAVRSPQFRNAVKSQPTLLFYRGVFQHAALRRERVTEGEVRSAVRGQGLGSMDDVEAVILETAGELSVIAHKPPSDLTALIDADQFATERARGNIR